MNEGTPNGYNPLENRFKPAPTEKPSNNESAEKLPYMINSVVVRIIASAEDKNFLNPHYKGETDQDVALLIDKLSKKSSENIDYRAVEALSKDARANYWETKGGTFDEQKNMWNKSVYKWIESQTNENNENREENISALNAAGFALDKNNIQSDLSEKIDNFYNSFLKEKSDIKRFVNEIAEASRDNGNGDINVEILEKRLNSMKGLLSSFGDTEIIPELIQDYAVAHGEISQEKDKKIKLQEYLKKHLVQEMPTGPEKNRLQALYNKEKDLEPNQQQQTEPREALPREYNAGVISNPKERERGPAANEDAYVNVPEKGFFGVLDGVGGHIAGDKASNTAREALEKIVSSFPQDKDISSADDLKLAIKNIILYANQAVVDKANSELTDEMGNKIRAYEGMATTCSAVKIWEEANGERKAVAVNVGDSRVYVAHADGSLEQVTTDDDQIRYIEDEAKADYIRRKFSNLSNDSEFDTALIKLNAAGQRSFGKEYISERELFNKRNRINQALGNETIEPNINIINLQIGDRLILTSDGIHDNLTDNEINTILKQQADPNACAKELFIKAQERSRENNNIRAKKDDMTALVVEIK